MIIDTVVLGAFQTNSYIVRAEQTDSHCIVIDAGLSPEPLIDFLEDRSLTPEAVLLTHGHVDHIGGIPDVQAAWPEVKIYIHTQDAALLADPLANLSIMMGPSITLAPPEHLLDHNQCLDISGVCLRVLHSPGHTPGGVSIYAGDAKVLFSGDALFLESVGRTDFPGGNMSQLIQSIKDHLFVLPDETTVYPGHGPQTTIGHEKQFNPYTR